MCHCKSTVAPLNSVEFTLDLELQIEELNLDDWINNVVIYYLACGVSFFPMYDFYSPHGCSVFYLFATDLVTAVLPIPPQLQICTSRVCWVGSGGFCFVSFWISEIYSLIYGVTVFQRVSYLYKMTLSGGFYTEHLNYLKDMHM